MKPQPYSEYELAAGDDTVWAKQMFAMDKALRRYQRSEGAAAFQKRMQTLTAIWVRTARRQKRRMTDARVAKRVARITPNDLVTSAMLCSIFGSFVLIERQLAEYREQRASQPPGQNCLAA